MYFLSHLLLSGAVVTAQDVDKTASTPNSANDTLKTSTAPVESIKTVSVTVTRTLYPAKTYPIPSYQPPTAKSSHVDVPPSLTHEGQQGGPPSPTGDTSDFLAGPIYQYASLASAKLHTASCAPYYPGASLTGQREFTFDTALVASTTIPFEGHFTPITGLTTKSMCEHRSTATSLSTSPAAPTIPYPTPTRSSVGYDSNPAQPTAPDETMDITPISTPTDNDFDILPPPDAEETMGILPLPTEPLVHALPVTSASPTSSARTYSSSARPTDSSLLHSAHQAPPWVASPGPPKSQTPMSMPATAATTPRARVPTIQQHGQEPTTRFQRKCTILRFKRAHCRGSRRRRCTVLVLRCNGCGDFGTMFSCGERMWDLLMTRMSGPRRRGMMVWRRREIASPVRMKGRYFVRVMWRSGIAGVDVKSCNSWVEDREVDARAMGQWGCK
jgi:hypothetical protein